MRGKNTFNSVFKAPEDSGKTKGRNTRLLAQRNACIADRYYYYGQFTQKRYETVIKILSNEFFLSELTIPDIIDGNMEYLAELRKENPHITYFAKKWPSMRWQ